MNLIEHYHQKCHQNLISYDLRQIEAITNLQNTYDELISEHKKRNTLYAIFRKPRLVKGAYLQGGVGIGKTLLMDMFYECFPFKNKLRLHFHEFMQFIHSQLKLHQGKKNPIKVVAKELAAKYMLICFDELFVSDISDAMILARLFESLYQHGICLIFTSNVVPNDLYQNGLQRSQFIPAITLLYRYNKIIQLEIDVDYRLCDLNEKSTFYFPNNQLSNDKMASHFLFLANDDGITCSPIKVHGRTIQVKKRTSSIIWFDFKSLCNIPRSQLDYLAIVRDYNTIFISDVPIISSESKNEITLFILLIDIIYNAQVKLVMSAAAPIDKLYDKGHALFEYARTRSRLLEMQSEKYYLKTGSTNY